MPKSRYLRPILASGFAAVLGGFFALGLDEYASYAALREHEAALRAAAQTHFFAAALAYALVYILVVLFSLPGALLLTLSGGLIFGALGGAVLAITSATAGACLFFIAARYFFGDFLRRKGGVQLQAFEAGFNKNAASYMLFLRLVPAFPFFAVNLAAALLGVRFLVFAATTLFGIMPASFILASIGSGISAVLQAGEEPDLSLMTRPEIILPLLGLAALSLLPIVFSKKR